MSDATRAQPENRSTFRTTAQPRDSRSRGASLAPSEPRLTQLRSLADASPQVLGLQALQMRAGTCLVQPRSGDGLGDALGAGVEALSGVPMDGVKVHRNSPQPAEIGALAFAQGRDIHLGPGQERHLPHEAWHVAQQFAGRVRPTTQAGGVPVNDDPALEREADVMGARALQHGAALQQKSSRAGLRGSGATLPVVRTPYAATAFQRQAEVANMDAQLGTTTTVMSRNDYAAWRETAQAKGAFHGTASLSGGRVVVSQMRRDGDVVQRFLSKKVKAGLLIFEGVVTIAAGTAAAVLTGGVGTVPAIIAAVVGFIKCCRGIAMWKFANDAEDASEAEKLTKEYKDRAAMRTQILDGMRTLEGILAIIGGAIAGNPMLIIFSIAKTVRAICTAISDYMGDNTKHPVLKKMLDAGAALAHAVEVVSLGGAAGGAIGGAETGAALAGGVMTAAVGGSKAVRAADQIVDQIPEKTGDDAQASESRDRSTSYDAPQASVSYVS